MPRAPAGFGVTMNTKMTPIERRAEARTLADTLRNDDMLREEVYALLEINPGKSAEAIKWLEDRIEGLEEYVADLKAELSEANARE